MLLTYVYLVAKGSKRGEADNGFLLIVSDKLRTEAVDTTATAYNDLALCGANNGTFVDVAR